VRVCARLMTPAISDSSNTVRDPLYSVCRPGPVEIQCFDGKWELWELSLVAIMWSRPAVIDRLPSCGRCPLLNSTKGRLVELSMIMAGLTSTGQ
jgi:hypothetical protein